MVMFIVEFPIISIFCSFDFDFMQTGATIHLYHRNKDAHSRQYQHHLLKHLPNLPSCCYYYF